MIPALPDWQGLHPLIVHFPIALLLVAPLFAIAGLAVRSAARPLSWAAFALMAAGSIAAIVAASTGAAAGELADRSPQVAAVLERHEELAEATRNAFVGLTMAYCVILMLPRVVKRLDAARPRIALMAAFLLCYAGGAVLLVNAAHHGGRLVHELGVRALLPPEATPGAASRGADD